MTVRDLLRLNVGLCTTEQFGVVLLDFNSRVLEVTTLFYGGVKDVAVDLRKLCGYVLTSRAHKVILWHNHPSLSKQFSKEDLVLTRAISERLALFDVEVVDHYLVTTTINSLRSSVNWPGGVPESRIPPTEAVAASYEFV
nr:JAB domain-containing protein [Reinekea sp. G2M2-21]